MKRITQILASIVFVITVVTVYLAFDFAINNAISSKDTPSKRSHHDHDHHRHGAGHSHDDNKISKKRSLVLPPLSQTKRTNRTVKNPNEQHRHPIFSNERQLRNTKPKPSLSPLRAKPGHFHKSKTGVKVNKPRKLNKDQRKILKTTTTTVAIIDSRNGRQLPNKQHHNIEHSLNKLN